MAKSEAVKQLELELLERDIERHPTMAAAFPRSYFVKPKREDTTANGLTRCIIDFITLHGGQAERITVMGKPVEQRTASGRTYGVKWVQGQMTVGSADISATIQGRSVKIEVKIGADRQSEAQRRYQSDIERAGGIYYIARNFADFKQWYYKQWPAM